MSAAAAKILVNEEESQIRMARDIKALSQHTADAAEEMRQKRAVARDRAIDTMYRVEQLVVSALDGETVRGMKNILPEPYGKEKIGFGANVRAENIDYKALPEKKTLFIGEDGKLGMIDLDTDHRKLCVRPPWDNEIEAQDLNKYLSALVLVLRRHADGIERRTRNYIRITDLAERVATSLSEF